MGQELQVWLALALCVGLVGLAGPELSRAGDIIAAKTGLSRSWVGLVLLATVTSLPELITGISSVTIAGTPDIAVGNVLGSCLSNLTMLAILDLLLKDSVYGRVAPDHVLSAAFGAVLIGFAGLNIVMPVESALSVGHVGLYTPVILALYAIAVRSVFFYERRKVAEFTREVAKEYPQITLRSAVIRYAGAALVVVGAGTWLPFVGADVAEVMGWGESFVGTLLVSGVTTLPELVVTIAALRLGALDLAVANLLGSNLFDVAILGIDDLLFAEGPLLASVSPIHALSAFSGVVMSAAVIAGFVYAPKKPRWGGLSWVSIGLVTMFLLNAYLVFRNKA